MPSRYELRLYPQPFDAQQGVPALAWNALLGQPQHPFMRHEYLAALTLSGSAHAASGWQPLAITLWQDGALHAACMLYIKSHSYGEYVFDFAWANAYAEHGLDYYPKALIAVPFTPVPGPRLLARDAPARQALVHAAVQVCVEHKLSSLHLLFGDTLDLQACEAQGLMLRDTVQFHWQNSTPPCTGFEAFLSQLSQEKRKKIRQERRKVAEAGVQFLCLQGLQITSSDWDFFYQCYAQTYLEHGNAPYLTREFFARMARNMPDSWLLFIAEREGRRIASSLVALQHASGGERVAYGRYWGALERVDCLHFEACYYQPLAWCLDNGFARFEGGAQGEHKMARALLPVKTQSAHWLAHPSFAKAVDQFLHRETAGVENYLAHLNTRSPLKQV